MKTGKDLGEVSHGSQQSPCPQIHLNRETMPCLGAEPPHSPGRLGMTAVGSGGWYRQHRGGLRGGDQVATTVGTGTKIEGWGGVPIYPAFPHTLR